MPTPVRSRSPFPLLLLAALATAGCGGTDTTTAVKGGGTTPVLLKAPVGTSPVRGPSDAWVTVVVFSDFECPFCATAQATLATVLPEFGDDVRLVYKHYPLSLHRYARPAAVAARCAHAQGLFWPFHDLLLAGQSAIFGGDVEAGFASVAAQAGLDVAAWQACRSDAAADADVVADMALGARLGVTGTPTFAVNGIRLVGSQPASVFRASIDAERTRARASGVPAAAYYDQVVLAP